MTPESRNASIEFWALLIESNPSGTRRFLQAFALEIERDARAEGMNEGAKIVREAVYPPHSECHPATDPLVLLPALNSARL